MTCHTIQAPSSERCVQLRGRHIKWNVFAVSELQLAVIMTRFRGRRRDWWNCWLL